MSKVFLSVVLVALTAVAANALTADDFKAIDNLLFNPFCQRDSVKSILNVCAPPAASKQDTNTFGTDAYTISTHGKVSIGAAAANAINKGVFLVAVPNAAVKCTLKGVGASDTFDKVVKLYKIADGTITEPVKADYTETGSDPNLVYALTTAVTDTVGVAIRIDTAKAVECSW